MSYSDIVIAIATAITAIATLGTLYYIKQDRKPDFHYEKYAQDQIWYIRIQFVTKLIRRFTITLDGNYLSLARLREISECSFQINGGDNFVIPLGSWKEDSEIIMKYDRYTKKVKFRDIPIATR